MCGCGGNKARMAPLFTVRMPNGELKTYSSEVAAKAKVRMVEGAELIASKTAEGVSV